MTVKEMRTLRTKLSVDFPRHGERITTPDYTIRLSAPEDAGSVELSIDGGAWRPCRKSVGYWWYDWSGCSDGRHQLAGRIVNGDGKTVSSEPHEVLVQRPRSD